MLVPDLGLCDIETYGSCKLDPIHIPSKSDWNAARYLARHFLHAGAHGNTNISGLCCALCGERARSNDHRYGGYGAVVCLRYNIDNNIDRVSVDCCECRLLTYLNRDN